MVTYEEYLAAPDPANKAELVRGEILYRQPGPVAHAVAIVNLVLAWTDYDARQAGLAATDDSHDLRQAEQIVAGYALMNLGIRYVLPDDPDQVRVLSLSIYTPAQYRRMRQTVRGNDFASAPPALAIDNIFPGDLSAYTQQKVNDLLAAGTQTIWLLHPLIPCIVVWTHDRGVHLYGLGDTLPEPAGFPGLELPVSQIFAW